MRARRAPPRPPSRTRLDLERGERQALALVGQRPRGGRDSLALLERALERGEPLAGRAGALGEIVTLSPPPRAPRALVGLPLELCRDRSARACVRAGRLVALRAAVSGARRAARCRAASRSRAVPRPTRARCAAPCTPASPPARVSTASRSRRTPSSRSSARSAAARSVAASSAWACRARSAAWPLPPAASRAAAEAARAAASRARDRLVAS